MIWGFVLPVMLIKGAARMLIRILLVALFLTNGINYLSADDKTITTKQKPVSEEKQKQPVHVLPTIKQFIPTEKIKADSAISLPVDI